MTPQDLIRAVGKLVAPLAQRIRLTVSRGVVKLINDSLKCQALQVELIDDEVADDVEHFQEYGFTSRPFKDSEAVFLSVGGNRAHGIVVCVADRRYRPKTLAEGESCLYTQQNGIRVHNKANGQVLLGTTPTDWVALTSLVDNRISAIQGKLDTVIGLYNGHTHPTPAGPSGPTTSVATPLGAQATVAAMEVKAK